MADNSNSAMTAVVVLLAVVVIAFLGFFALRAMQSGGLGGNARGGTIDVNLQGGNQ